MRFMKITKHEISIIWKSELLIDVEWKTLRYEKITGLITMKFTKIRILLKPIDFRTIFKINWTWQILIVCEFNTWVS